MTIEEKTVHLPELRMDVTYYTAYLSFSDYEHIFPIIRWRCPVSFRCYGHPYVSGIEGVCTDGTVVCASFIALRDAIDNFWPELKAKLQEKEGPNLDKYTELVGVHPNRHETLSLRCSTLVFKTGQAACCSFDRIWGRIRW